MELLTIHVNENESLFIVPFYYQLKHLATSSISSRVSTAQKKFELPWRVCVMILIVV
jgi:hypothetical protein